jgi:siroheme decarboxylase
MRTETERVLSKVPADFPLVEHPYDVVGAKAGLSGDELIEALKQLKETGVIRRIAAILYHRRASYTCNAMVVWRVPEEEIEEMGRRMASYPQVSHCYQRETGGYWDYSLYTMIHGRSEEECVGVVRDIAQVTGIDDFRIFFSKRELKKTALVVSDE